MKLVYLNFHGVGPIPRAIDQGEHHCWLGAEKFEAILDLVQHESAVRLTVDDGNISDYEIVLPALLERGLHATFFVCSGRLGQATFLSHQHLHGMLEQGMTIGSHGANHVSWRGLSSDMLKAEVDRSTGILAEVCGAPITSAACPFGAYDRRALQALHRRGFKAVYTSDGGRTSSRAWLRARTTITRSMSLPEIEQLVKHGPHKCTQGLIRLRQLIKRLR